MSTQGNEQNLSIRHAVTPHPTPPPPPHPPDKSFFFFFYCRNKCHTAVVKASLCSFESIFSVSWRRLPWAVASHHFLPLPPSLFASCHQSTEPAVFTELTKIMWHILTANEVFFFVLEGTDWHISTAELINRSSPALKWLSLQSNSDLEQKTFCFWALRISRSCLTIITHWMAVICESKLSVIFCES